jgi:hypothetical protein
MDGTDVAKIVQGHLSKLADELGKNPGGKVSADQIAAALSGKWVCTLSIDDPGLWRWYNTATGEWGGQCNP